jgi:hypothetical protein
LERIFGLFPREQVLILRAEDLRAEPTAALASVRRFLDLPGSPPPAHREAHVGRDIDYGSALTAEDAAHLRRLYARDQARLKDLTGFSYDG